MNQEINRLDHEILLVQQKITPLVQELEKLRRLRDTKASQLFIEVNDIHRADVEESKGGDKPWFGHFQSFIDWIKCHRTGKRFVEWNGRLYFMTDLLNGTMPETPGYFEHVKP